MSRRRLLVFRSSAESFFYILRKNDRFVRFYAMQSIIFGGVWIRPTSFPGRSCTPSLAVRPGNRRFLLFWGLVSVICAPRFLAIPIITIVKASTNVRWDIPYIGPIAHKLIDGTVVKETGEAVAGKRACCRRGGPGWND